MKSLALLALTVLFLTSCENYEDEYEEMKTKNANLKSEIQRFQEEERFIKGEYSETIEVLNAIEDTLRSIERREERMQALTKSSEIEGTVSQRQEVLNRLNALRDYNEEATAEARRLQKKLNAFKIENRQLKTMIKKAEERLAAKDRELKEAQNVIDDMQTALNRLESQLLEKSGELATAYEKLKAERDALIETNQQLMASQQAVAQRDDFIEECARAYVACGSKKALRQNNIMRKLGSGLTNDYQEEIRKLNTFINFYHNDEVSCDGGQIEEVLPERPSDSYRVEGNRLIITNRARFWEKDQAVVLVKE